MTKNWLVDPNQGHYYMAFDSQLDNNNKKFLQIFFYLFHIHEGHNMVISSPALSFRRLDE